MSKAKLIGILLAVLVATAMMVRSHETVRFSSPNDEASTNREGSTQSKQAEVHHSDRGVQHASQEYTELLLEHRARISMSRRGNPYDNARAESFIKTLKYEEVYRQEYHDLGEARGSIKRFLEKIYNKKRLHFALGYLPPAEFEQSLAPRVQVLETGG